MTSRPDPAGFWAWFREHEAYLRPEVVAAAPTGEVMRQLDRRVRALGAGLSWEIGPGLERENAFVLSPGGVRENLVVSDAVVGAAPVDLPAWEFHAARPPKRWDRRFQLQRGQGWLDVDARSWRYTLVGFNRGEFFDVTLHIGTTLRDASDEERQHAAWILLDGELGERCTIERIGAVAVSDDPVDVARSGAVEHLAEHVRSLSGRGPRP